MNKIALAERLEGYSKVFASECPLAIDLVAMGKALRDMSDEKFASIVDAAFEADKEADYVGQVAPKYVPHGRVQTPGMRNRQKYQDMGKPGEKAVMNLIDRAGDGDEKAQAEIMNRLTKSAMGEVYAAEDKEAGQNAKCQKAQYKASDKPVNDKAAGENWSKEASAAVLNALVRDVTGMNKEVCCDTKQELTKEQMPDGEKKAEKPSTLTDDQTPDVAEALDTNMVAESNKAPLKKEAASEAQERARENFKKMIQKKKKQGEQGEKSAQESQHEKAEKSAAKGGRAAERARARKEEQEKAEQKKRLEKVEEAQKGAEAASEDQTVVAEGFEFEASIQDIEINPEEQKKLASLFQ